MAFLRKSKTVPEPPRDRQRVRTGTGEGETPRTTTFSYYANRPVQDSGTRRPPQRQRPKAFLGSAKLSNVTPRLGIIPFVLLIAVVLGIAARVLYLSNNPRVVVLGSTSAANSNIGSTDEYARTVSKVLASSILNRCKLTLDTGGAAHELLKDYPELQAASVSSQFLSSNPVVTVVPAQPKLVLQSGEARYAINADGVAYGTNPAAASGSVTVTDQSGASAAVGKQALPSGTVAFIETVAFQLKQARQNVAGMVLPATSAYELDVQLAGKPFVARFNLEEDARLQSGVLLATLHHLGKSTPNQYIDLRVPGRVYYK